MTAVSVGSVIRVRATFRDGGKLFDPPVVQVDVGSGDATKRLTSRSGDVARESIGVYSAIVSVGGGPTLTVRFSNGGELFVEQTFDVIQRVDQAIVSAPARGDASDPAVDAVRAAARISADAERAAPPQRRPIALTVDDVRARARAAAQVDVDRAHAAELELEDERHRRAARREELRNQGRKPL